MVAIGRVAACLLLLCATAAEAQPLAPPRFLEDPAHPVTLDDAPLPPSFRPGWLPTVLSVVPGAAIHGAGHAAAGDWSTGYKLLAVEGVGLATTAAGVIPIALSGASRRIVGPAVALTLLGAGLLVTSWGADIYGAAGGGRRAVAPSVVLPLIEAQLGYAYVHDPQFRYGSFAVTRLDARLSRLRLSPEIWLAMDDDNQRYRAELALRLLGPRPTPAAPKPDGSFVDLQSAVIYHRFGSDSFKVLTVELTLAGRYDLRRLARSLRGSFAQMELGWALELYGYDATGEGLGQDVAELLLARFGYGIYLGRPGQRQGELFFYYDHRHDDFAAGVGMGLRTDGPGGHGGIQGLYYLTRRWGIAADFQAGAAYLGRISLVHRSGGTR